MKAVTKKEDFLATVLPDEGDEPLELDELMAGADDPTVDIEVKKPSTGKLTKLATFVAIVGKGTKDEKKLDLFQITIVPTKEVLSRGGLRGVPGSSVIVKFDSAQATVSEQWIVDEIMSSDDWLIRIHPNPLDPSGYWREVGIMKEVTTPITTMELTGAAVHRGAQTLASTAVASTGV